MHIMIHTHTHIQTPFTRSSEAREPTLNNIIRKHISIPASVEENVTCHYRIPLVKKKNNNNKEIIHGKELFQNGRDVIDAFQTSTKFLNTHTVNISQELVVKTFFLFRCESIHSHL